MYPVYMGNFWTKKENKVKQINISLNELCVLKTVMVMIYDDHFRSVDFVHIPHCSVISNPHFYEIIFMVIAARKC